MTRTSAPVARQATCVALAGVAVLIEGAPGAGKSSLALDLIDRGAMLVGDDSVLLHSAGGRLIAQPHPNTRGLLEVRNLGLIPFPCADAIPVALVIELAADAPRYIETARHTEICGIALPLVQVWPTAGSLAFKVEIALRQYGLSW